MTIQHIITMIQSVASAFDCKAAQGFTSAASYVMHAMPVRLCYLVKLLYMVSKPMVVAAWLASPVMHSSHGPYKQ